MDKKPSISVVIPAYNEEKYLPRCLESLKNQTYQNFEIIVVDNNSTDKTAAIAGKFGARVIRETVQGTTPARERGFREAKAEIIARTDADTIVTPNWLEVIHESFRKYPKVVAMTGPWLSSNPKIPNKLITAYSYFYSVTLGKLMSNHIYLAGPNMALWKSVWEKLKVTFDDTKVHEDIDLSCHLAEVGKIMFNKRMKIYFSLRRLEEKPISGIKKYFGEYPIRYIKTLYYNKDGLFKVLPKIRKLV